MIQNSTQKRWSLLRFRVHSILHLICKPLYSFLKTFSCSRIAATNIPRFVHNSLQSKELRNFYTRDIIIWGSALIGEKQNRYFTGFDTGILKNDNSLLYWFINIDLQLNSFKRKILINILIHLITLNNISNSSLATTSLNLSEASTTKTIPWHSCKINHQCTSMYFKNVKQIICLIYKVWFSYLPCSSYPCKFEAFCDYHQLLDLYRIVIYSF